MLLAQRRYFAPILPGVLKLLNISPFEIVVTFNYFSLVSLLNECSYLTVLLAFLLSLLIVDIRRTNCLCSGMQILQMFMENWN